MKISLPGLIAIAVIAGVAGCAPVSQQAAAANKMIAFQRKCDANAASADPSFWRRVDCLGGEALPSECDKPGTDDLPACQAWLSEQKHKLDEAGIVGAIQGAVGAASR